LRPPAQELHVSISRKERYGCRRSTGARAPVDINAVSLARTELDPAAPLIVRIARSPRSSVHVECPRLRGSRDPRDDHRGDGGGDGRSGHQMLIKADPSAGRSDRSKSEPSRRMFGWRDSAGYGSWAVPAGRVRGGGPVSSSMSWPSSSTADGLARSWWGTSDIGAMIEGAWWPTVRTSTATVCRCVPAGALRLRRSFGDWT
jgi:hypothetical protein